MAEDAEVGVGGGDCDEIIGGSLFASKNFKHSDGLSNFRR